MKNQNKIQSDFKKETYYEDELRKVLDGEASGTRQFTRDGLRELPDEAVVTTGDERDEEDSNC